MDGALGGAAGAPDYHVERAIRLGSWTVQSNAPVEGPDGRQILLETAGGFQSAGGEEPRGVSGELVASDGEPVDVVEPAESFESFVLSGESFLCGVCPG